jgi:hypothetical protein
MPASDAFLSFSSLGSERFEEIVLSQEVHLAPDFENKPTTIRLPVYKLDALDTFARALSIPRQALIERLIDSALGDALDGYACGFGENFSEWHPEHGPIEWLSGLDHPSDISRGYLMDAIKRSLGLEEHHA